MSRWVFLGIALNQPSGIVVLATSSLCANPLLQLLHRAGPTQAAIRLMWGTLQRRDSSPISWTLFSRSINLGAVLWSVNLGLRLRRGHISLDGCRLRWLQFDTVYFGEWTFTVGPILLEAVALCISLLSLLFFCGGGDGCVLTVNLTVALILLDFGFCSMVGHMVDLLRSTLLHF